ncbi:MAG: hypothetical protein EA405_04320 [Rhodospirillales bacterium]|nr:MAG: hypothetical protein EA405_04320 [Rhodospirillales bacterium]
MAKIHIRYLVQKKFKKGIDYYWQPSAELRAVGFRPQRLADDIETAIRQAEKLNRQVDDWRKGAEPT